LAHHFTYFQRSNPPYFCEIEHMTPNPRPTAAPDDFTTIEVARMLGMSVRSIQVMVDRGELQAWKTPGGHRRIARESVESWRSLREKTGGERSALRALPPAQPASLPARCRALLIDDSVHFQKLISLLVRQRFPEIDLQVADDGIAGLALYGKLQPQILIVDILMPGIDGVTLINALRSHEAFANSRLVVVTSLDESQRAPYAFALGQVPVIHKPRLVTELPALFRQWLPAEVSPQGSVADAA
jgi:excisionase family DNA binding protein